MYECAVGKKPNNNLLSQHVVEGWEQSGTGDYSLWKVNEDGQKNKK